MGKPAEQRYLLHGIAQRIITRKAAGARAVRQRVKTKLINLGAVAALVRNANFKTYSESNPYAETFIIKRRLTEVKAMEFSCQM